MANKNLFKTLAGMFYAKGRHRKRGGRARLQAVAKTGARPVRRDRLL